MTEQGKSSNTINSQLLAHYKATGDHYLHNAGELTGKKEFRKASEMLWGTATQAVKALAASKGIRLYGLQDLYGFVRQVAKEKNDDTIRSTFYELHTLHTNFYDENIPEDDFPRYYELTVGFVSRIYGLIQ